MESKAGFFSWLIWLLTLKNQKKFKKSGSFTVRGTLETFAGNTVIMYIYIYTDI